MNREQIAEMYELESGHWWFWSKRRVMRGLLRDRLQRPGQRAPGRDLRILDIGCGAGANALELSAFGAVTASDRSLDALAYVRSRGVERVVAAEAPRLPFADASFDLVTAYDVIEHVEDDRGFVRELARVLAPGGTLAVHVPAWPSLWSGHDVALDHKRRYTRPGLRQLLERSGLRIERLSWTNCAIFVPVAASRWLRNRFGTGDDSANLGVVPAPVNALLRAVGRVEAALASTTGLPFGVSLAAIATRDDRPLPQESDR